MREIAEMIGMPERTVKFHMHRLNISVRTQYNTISNEDLDILVGDILEVNPHLGEYNNLTSS